jgi:small subunit ribosomal protein S2
MTDIIKDIKETIEKGEEAIEKVVEEIKEKVTKARPKVEKKKAKKEKEVPADKDLAKSAEAESTTREKSLEERKKELLAKVKKLAGKVDITKTEELKERVKIKKRADMLIPLEEYVKSGIYLGTRVVTPEMKPFVYRRRADGLAIFNTDLIDEKLKEAIEFLSKFDAKDVILACKRQAGWKAAEMFGEITGIKVFTKKYPAGILTNTSLPDFFENKLTIVTDAWLDKNALNDTLNIHKQVLMICDTNNFPKRIKSIIIGNNKSPRSLGVIFYLLAKSYCKAKGIEADIPDLEDWEGEGEEIVKKIVRAPPRRSNRRY